MYNDKVMDVDDLMTDTIMSVKSEAISIPVIQDITKDENFVDVRKFVCISLSTFNCMLYIEQLLCV